MYTYHKRELATPALVSELHARLAELDQQDVTAKAAYRERMRGLNLELRSLRSKLKRLGIDPNGHAMSKTLNDLMADFGDGDQEGDDQPDYV